MENDNKIAFRKAKRAIIWDLLYYSLSLFCTFYLIKKDEILNWDVMLVFLPLIFLACSSETFSAKSKQKQLRPYCFIDFIFKVIAYICSQTIYRHIAVNIFFWVSISGFSVCVIISIVCFVFMILKTKPQQ